MEKVELHFKIIVIIKVNLKMGNGLIMENLLIKIIGNISLDFINIVVIKLKK
jgi:hypothetical protein